MQSKLLIALFAALTLTACQKSEEAAAPSMEEAQEAAGAAADSAAEAADSAAEAAAAAAAAAATAAGAAADTAGGEGMMGAPTEASQGTADTADQTKGAAQ